MFGKGLLKGLSVTWNFLWGKAITEEYPERRPRLPSYSRGFLQLDKEKCIACGLCATSCPNNVIHIETVKDEQNKRQLKAYRITVGRCIYCGLCVESCPKGALYWVPDFERACYRHEDTEVDLLAAEEVKGGA
ncbi:MAG TPA: NADH-quinone oxidoreductase subunit I [Moorella mulderi]|nr:NADH-quinone oxidoreductase subunit I [Moorella mulderi]